MLSLKRISSWIEGRVLRPAGPDVIHPELTVAHPTAARWNQRPSPEGVVYFPRSLDHVKRVLRVPGMEGKEPLSRAQRREPEPCSRREITWDYVGSAMLWFGYIKLLPLCKPESPQEESRLPSSLGCPRGRIGSSPRAQNLGTVDAQQMLFGSSVLGTWIPLSEPLVFLLSLPFVSSDLQSFRRSTKGAVQRHSVLRSCGLAELCTVSFNIGSDFCADLVVPQSCNQVPLQGLF